jgi:anti-sigma regulatory factor (Ser/Thr protein kinase)
MVTGPVDPGALRRELAQRVLRHGATGEGCGRVKLVATELATNLLEHAKPGGYVLSRALPGARIELIAVDRGPGMADVGASLTGHSGAAGLGCGLAAVRRASTLFDVHTVVGQGTAVLSVIDLIPGRQRSAPDTRGLAGVSVAVAEQCGDAWAAIPVDGGGIAVTVIDGLGHGAAASAAADAAITAFAGHADDLAGFVSRANAAMRDTRGGAVTACVIHPRRGVLEYVAVGNVNGRVLSPVTRQNLITYPGTLGLAAIPPSIRVLSCPWPAGATLVLWTDGLTSAVSGVPDDPDLLRHDPALLAAVLHRDYTKDRDDATVAVIRAPGGP